MMIMTFWTFSNNEHLWLFYNDNRKYYWTKIRNWSEKFCSHLPAKFLRTGLLSPVCLSQTNPDSIRLCSHWKIPKTRVNTNLGRTRVSFTYACSDSLTTKHHNLYSMHMAVDNANDIFKDWSVFLVHVSSCCWIFSSANIYQSIN